MFNIKPTFRHTFRRIADSIAFLPSVIAFALSIFAALMIWIEYMPWLQAFRKPLDLLLVESVEDGRLLLGTLVGSVITLMVFSFSMVMVVLNQASSNLSPRLLPGLITIKDNQIVLGSYLGTICYCLLLILNIHPDADEHRIPSFGIFIGMILGLYCLSLFTYFIHSISTSIQVDTIIQRLYKRTLKNLGNCDQKGSASSTSPSCTITLESDQSGYLKWVEEEQLCTLCQKHDLQIQLLSPIGSFHLKGDAFLKINKEISKDTQKTVLECFAFYPEEKLDDHFSFGFKQISEIAVKALSPGINDPATAIKAIDVLALLLIEKCTHNERNCACDNEGNGRIYFPSTQFDFLMDMSITPIRIHGTRDSKVMRHLLKMLLKVIGKSVNQEQKTSLQNHIVAILESCDNTAMTTLDKNAINQELEAAGNSESIGLEMPHHNIEWAKPS